jgi:hypothetical protein
VTVNARKSADRKFVVCGTCGRSLCRRDRVVRLGQPVHVLVWDDGWRVVDEHIEMTSSARGRLAEGNKPSRRDWTNEARIELSRSVGRHVPALCPSCGTMNLINLQKLDVDGIAPH